MRLRRLLGRVPFIYSLYRKSRLLQNLDMRLRFSSLSPFSLFSRYILKGSPADDARKLQYFLENKRYTEALYKATVLLEKGHILSNDTLFALLQACMQLKAWDFLNNTFFPVFENMAIAAKRDHSLIVKEHCQGILEELALHLIQNAKIDLAVKTLYLMETISSKPRSSILIALLHFMQGEIAETERRGTIIRQRKQEGEINLIGSIVWGEKYLEGFMTYNVRSMLASGNIPALGKHGLVVHSIVTTPAGRDFILAHPVYRDWSQQTRVEFFCFPEHLLELFKGEEGPDKWSYLLYGVLDHLNIFFARSLKANLFLIPVDSVVASPSFTHMRRYIKEGFDCCGGGNLVAEREGFLNALANTYGTAGPLDIPTRQLATLALQHPHNYITSQLIHDKNKSFGKHPRELFWPTEGGIYVHSIYTHPLVISAARICGDYIMPYSWVDFLLPPRLFTDEREFSKYKIIENAEEAYINNYAPQSREYEVTGRAFNAEDFATAHMHSYPIHRFMLNTRQFIPCDYPPLTCGNNIDSDMEAVKAKLEEVISRTPFNTDKAELNPASLHGCHLCGGMDMEQAMDFGPMPLSRQYCKTEMEEKPKYPLRFHYCNACGLLQIIDPLPSGIADTGSGYSPAFHKPKHIEDLIISALSYRASGPVLDVGCGDGSLLQALDIYGFPLLVGMETDIKATNIARESNACPIYHNSLTSAAAGILLNAHGKFDFIFARHVAGRIANLKDFFAGINMLLSDNGLFIMEIAHTETAFNASNPSTLSEDRVNYFTESGIRAMLGHYGFQVIDKRHYAFAGGSAAFIAQRKTPQPLDLETAKGYLISYYHDFAKNVFHLGQELNALIENAKARNYEIALYGASQRSCMLLNITRCGEKIDHIIDDNPDIQDTYLPGTLHAIAALDRIRFTGKPLLVLLGVGAENEHIVLARLKQALGLKPVSVSLFPPRNIYTDIHSAMLQVTGQAIIQDNPTPVSLEII